MKSNFVKCYEEKDRAVHKSNCCDANLIYYNTKEDCFYGNEGSLLITKAGIDNIKALHGIITGDDFRTQRKGEE
tara:strand:- start:349 stop:570 length:222 start_codon:yes stop_codon:yes gene_type:complete